MAARLLAAEIPRPGGRRPGGAPWEVLRDAEMLFARRGGGVFLFADARRAAPLVIGRQAEGLGRGELARLALLGGEPCAEGFGVLEGHHHGRMRGALLVGWFRPFTPRIFHEGLVILHPRLPHAEEDALPAGGSTGDRNGDEPHAECVGKGHGGGSAGGSGASRRRRRGARCAGGWRRGDHSGSQDDQGATE